MKLSAKLFLEEEEHYILGPGRMAMLRAIETLGSLHKVAQSLGMSYRWAWGRLKDAEKALGIKLLMQEGPPGGGKAKVLTAEARELLQWYTEVEEKVAKTMREIDVRRPDFLKNVEYSGEPGELSKKNVI